MLRIILIVVPLFYLHWCSHGCSQHITVTWQEGREEKGRAEREREEGKKEKGRRRRGRKKEEKRESDHYYSILRYLLLFWVS